jgi:ribosome biogenesis GTPase
MIEHPAPDEGLTSGKVIRVDAGSCQVDMPGGPRRCTLRKRLGRSPRHSVRLICVGDDVQVQPSGDGQGVIEEILPRRSKLSRRAGGRNRREQVVAVNIDLVVVVSSFAAPAPSFSLIDHYLVAAHVAGIPPMVCFNKEDLARGEAAAEEISVYRGLGYPVLCASAREDIGIDALRSRLQQHTSVLAGASGVGKSTLLNAVQPGLQLRTAPVSGKSGEGRHTTTASQLLPLAGSGYVIDTPGIREYGLWRLAPPDVAAAFPEIRAEAAGCRFSNCLHRREPGCAVQAAADRGQISPRRYRSYLEMLRELEAPGQRGTPRGGRER